MADTTSALTAILVPAERQAEIQSEQSEAQATLAQLREWPCITPEDEQDLADILGAIKSKSKDLEEKRTSITGPLNLAKRAVDALFRPAKNALEEAETIIKGKLAQADRRREEARRAALLLAQESAAKAQAAKAQGDVVQVQAATQAAAVALASAPTSGSSAAPDGVHFRYQWKWELEDIGQVPMDFLALNHATMKIYTSRFKDREDIPPVSGIRFFRERIVVAREG